jgi:hypothetical protein
VLQPTQYVIMELQYRLGGPSINKDFKAWGILDHFIIPFIKYDPKKPLSYLDIHSRDDIMKIRAPVYHRAVDDWYKDYVTEGEYAHIVNHYGEARARMVGKGHEVMGQQLNMMMNMFLQELGSGSGMPSM